MEDDKLTDKQNLMGFSFSIGAFVALTVMLIITILSDLLSGKLNQEKIIWLSLGLAVCLYITYNGIRNFIYAWNDKEVIG